VTISSKYLRDARFPLRLQAIRRNAVQQHGEGKFQLPMLASQTHFSMKYSIEAYPRQIPNGSDMLLQGIASADACQTLGIIRTASATAENLGTGRTFSACRSDDFTPWMEAFVNARVFFFGGWAEKKKSDFFHEKKKGGPSERIKNSMKKSFKSLNPCMYISVWIFFVV